MIDLVSKVEERERGQAALSSELGIPEVQEALAHQVTEERGCCPEGARAQHERSEDSYCRRTGKACSRDCKDGHRKLSSR